MVDAVTSAREVLDLFDRGDADGLRAAGSPGRVWEQSVKSWLQMKRAQLDELAGPEHRIVSSRLVIERIARFVVEGPRGRAYVTVRLDPAGRWDRLVIRADEREGGIPNGAVLACPADRCGELRAFYAHLVQNRLGFGEIAEYYLPPRWPDPAYPQQMHLDILVADVFAAEEGVMTRGATKLQERETYRTYADPVGHPFCLYEDASGRVGTGNAAGVLAAIVIDCPDPPRLASFYAQLLRVAHRTTQRPDRLVLADGADTLPTLAFQYAETYLPPRWPDPAHPAQMHFDFFFDDRKATERRAQELGATWLAPPHGRGHDAVYADPAGHPSAFAGRGSERSSHASPSGTFTRHEAASVSQVSQPGAGTQHRQNGWPAGSA